MTYITIKCPHCNSRIRQTTSGSYDWGTPFRRCHKCGKNYIDSYFHEVAVEGFSRTDGVRSSWWLMLTPISLAGMLSIGYPIALVVVLGLLIVMILGLRNASIKRKKLMDVEMKRSINRLSNREYALALKNAGYDVPSQYLDSNFQM